MATKIRIIVENELSGSVGSAQISSNQTMTGFPTNWTDFVAEIIKPLFGRIKISSKTLESLDIDEEYSTSYYNAYIEEKQVSFDLRKALDAEQAARRANTKRLKSEIEDGLKERTRLKAEIYELKNKSFKSGTSMKLYPEPSFGPDIDLTGPFMRKMISDALVLGSGFGVMKSVEPKLTIDYSCCRCKHCVIRQAHGDALKRADEAAAKVKDAQRHNDEFTKKISDVTAQGVKAFADLNAAKDASSLASVALLKAARDVVMASDRWSSIVPYVVVPTSIFGNRNMPGSIEKLEFRTMMRQGGLDPDAPTFFEYVRSIDAYKAWN